MASIGAVFQGRKVGCEHVQGDITDVGSTARLIRDVDPDVIFSAATSRSPRGLAQADLDPETRSILTRATFGMWLPAHLLPTTRLVEAIMEAGAGAPLVTAAFPDVVNPAIWKRFGRGPVAGSGNGEVSAAILHHYVAAHREVDLTDVRVAVVGSHAFFVHGAEVPHWIRAWVGDDDITGTFDAAKVLSEYPERMDWRRASTFSVFAASAAKNIYGLLSPEPIYTHITAPMGLPGSYPVHVSDEGVALALPAEITFDEALSVTVAGNAHDGIARIEDDGTVVFTDDTVAAMKQLGYDGARVRFDELEDRVEALEALFTRITR